MSGLSRAACIAAVAMVAAVAAQPGATAEPGSLPSASEGPSPGPPALHAPPATSPLLDNTGRWRAEPLLVSGAAAYRSGEYVYQDYLHDDHGANTTDRLFASPEPRPPTSELAFGGMTGDVVYPTDEERYGFNAADLVELRLRPNADSVAYRFTLNTLLAEDSTAIAVGIDGDGDGGDETDWGHGLGVLGPLDVDHVLFTDGASAEVDGQPVDVRTDLLRNQIEVVIPRDVLDPGRDTWRHYAVTGIADGEGGFAALADEPDATQPGGQHGTDAPPVFNVAFRFEAEGDEPRTGAVADSRGTRSAGAGNWSEHGQALGLESRDISEFVADVDFGKLADGVGESNAPEHGFMNRILVSSLDLGEGVADERPWLLGQLQPYAVYVPESYDASEPASLLLVLHSLSATYNQFQVFSPNTYVHLAEERGAIAATTMGRGPDGWYLREAELDVFEVWADVARNYRLDPDRVAATGYSMGGYGTFRLTTLWPDLFAKGFPVVGPPAEGIVVAPQFDDTVDTETNTFHVLDNVRNIPLLMWNGSADELVPVTGTVTHAQRLRELDYRFFQDVFTADHFALAEVDDWTRAAGFLGEAEVDRDPAHVTFRVMPAADAPDLGLVHDHAYWLWDVTIRDQEGDPATGRVDAFSRGFGVGDPPASSVAGAGPDPLPYVRHGVEWGETPGIDTANMLEVDLENVAGVTAAVARAELDPREELVVDVTSDGSAQLRLAGDFPPNVEVYSEDSADAVAYRREASDLVLQVPEGHLRIVVRPATGAAVDSPPDTPDGAAAGQGSAGDLPATGGGLTTLAAVALLAGRVAQRGRRASR